MLKLFTRHRNNFIDLLHDYTQRNVGLRATLSEQRAILYNQFPVPWQNYPSCILEIIVHDFKDFLANIKSLNKTHYLFLFGIDEINNNTNDEKARFHITFLKRLLFLSCNYTTSLYQQSIIMTATTLISSPSTSLNSFSPLLFMGSNFIRNKKIALERSLGFEKTPISLRRKEYRVVVASSNNVAASL